MNATRTQLNAQLRLVQDPRLSFFSMAMPGSKGSHSTASKQIKKTYGLKCLFCGSDEAVTLAHLVAGNADVNYSPFGKPNYRDALDVKSPRNFILLCGTFGKRGSCHNEFDNYLIGMVPVPLAVPLAVPLEEGASHCTLICLRPTFEKYEELNNKIITVLEPHPYRRLLAWRNRKCLLEHGRLCSDNDIQNALRACDLSEIANSINDGDADNDDADSDSAHSDNADSDSVDPDYEDGVPVNSVA